MDTSIQSLQSRPDIKTEDLQNFINMAGTMASEAISRLVAEMVPGATSVLPPPHETGHVTISFGDEVKQIAPQFSGKMNIMFILADKDYDAMIDIPSGYESEVCKQYIFLKQLAVTYWTHILSINPRLKDYLADSKYDFSNLHVSETNQTTLYFDKNYPKRIALFPYHIDINGQPLLKRGVIDKIPDMKRR